MLTDGTYRPNILSSVQFMWDNNGRLGFSCYFFEYVTRATQRFGHSF